MVLIIDNYDSFTFNLYQAVGELQSAVKVVRNDATDIAGIREMAPSHIILSPGPGRPEQAGVCMQAATAFVGEIPVLGVCLGHQAICAAFGAEVTYASTLLHGKQSDIHIANGAPIFRGLPPLIAAGRYHSLAVRRDTLPDELLVIAEDTGDEVMGVKHRDCDVYGVQFHPESILTPLGARIIENFLKLGVAK